MHLKGIPFFEIFSENKTFKMSKQNKEISLVFFVGSNFKFVVNSYQKYCKKNKCMQRIIFKNRIYQYLISWIEKCKLKRQEK